MSNPDERLLALFAERPSGVLITLKRDGSPQASIVGHSFDPATRTIRVSITDDRAKTRNLRRDRRASYLVSAADQGRYAVGEGDAALSAVTTDPQDASAEALVALYRDIAGEHPDWDEFRSAMVAERRLVLTLRFDHVYGWTGPTG